jgi:two-component system, NtrC family, response regulator AtoC
MPRCQKKAQHPDQMLQSVQLTFLRGVKMILVVEDEPAIRLFITVNLKKRGYDVIGAASAEQALEYIHETIPALMFLDVRLPGISGIDLVNRLNEIPDLPFFCVVLMSASPLDDQAYKLYRIVELLHKPIGVPQVLAALERAQIAPQCAVQFQDKSTDLSA